MNKKKILAAVIAAASVTVMGSCTNYKKLMEEAPGDYIQESFKNSLEAAVSRDSFGIYEQIKGALENGSVSVEVVDGDIIYSAVSNNNSKEQENNTVFKILSGSDTKFSVTAGRDKDNIYISESGESGENSYRISLEDFQDNFEDSIFYYDSDSSYSFSEASCEFISEFIGNISDDDGDNDKKNVMSEFIELLNKREHTFETSKVNIGDDNVKTDTITFELDEEEISELMYDTADIIEELGVDESYTYELESFAEEISNVSSKLTASFYINSKTHCLMMAECKFKIEDEGTISCELFFGSDPAETEEYYLNFKVSDVGSIKLSLSDSDSTKDSVVWDAGLKIDDYGDKTNASGSIEYNKKTEDYEASLKIPVDYEEEIKIKVTGKIIPERSSAKITVEKISADTGNGSDSVDINASVEFSDKYQELPNKEGSEELLDISEEEFEELGSLIGDDLVEAFSDSSDSEVSEYVEESNQTARNANAKQVYTAVSAALTSTGIYGTDISEGGRYDDTTVIMIKNSGDGKIIPVYTDTQTDMPSSMELIDYLGSGFTGYGYAIINPSGYYVTSAFWSDEEIPEDYLHALTSEEAKEYRIGCYPFSEE